MTCGIYALINKNNGKLYVGQSNDIEKRYRQHKHDAKHRTSLIHRVMRAEGIDSFELMIIEVCNEGMLEKLEDYYIRKLNTLVPNGYNEIIRTRHNRGWKHDEYAKELIRRTKMGYLNPMYGKKLSEEHRQKQRESLIGNTYNTETILMVDYISNTILGRWDGLTNASKDSGIKSGTIWNRLKNKIVVGNIYWAYEKDFTPEYRNALRISAKNNYTW